MEKINIRDYEAPSVSVVRCIVKNVIFSMSNGGTEGTNYENWLY